MTTEQEGAPSATAGGASAPGPWDIGHSPATGGRNLYVRDADGDVYVGVIFEPADARRIVEAMNAAERPRLADPRDAEIERLRKEYDEVLVSGVLRETLCAEIERLRGELDKANTGWEVWRDEQRARDKRQDNELRVVAQRLHELIGDTEPCAMAFISTRHLHGLLDRVVAEPSPETDRMRGELCRIRDIALVVLNVLPDDDDRSAVDLVREILETVGPGALGRDKQFSDLIAERDRKRRELADVTAERDRLRQELDLQHADRLRWLCEALNIDSASETWLTAMRRVRHLRQNFSDSPRCEVSESDGWRCRLFAGHDGKHLAQKPTGERREWPFDNKRAPRYWRVGDPEPEIGTTVWRGPDKYTRSSNGWHRIDIHTGYASWAWILSIGSEIVEAVDHG